MTNETKPAADEEIKTLRHTMLSRQAFTHSVVLSLIARIDAEKANAKRLFDALECMRDASDGIVARAADVARATALLDELRPSFT